MKRNNILKLAVLLMLMLMQFSLCVSLLGLSIHADKLPISVFFQKISQVMHQNILLTQDVSGDVSVNLHNVSWSEALKVLLKTQNLVEEQMGDITVIMSEKRYKSYQQSSLQSQQKLAELVPLKFETIPLHFASAVKLAALLGSQKNGFLSRRGKITDDKRTNTLLIEDTPEKIKQVRSLVGQLDIPIKQVLIKARIVSADRKYQQEIGVRLGFSRPRHLSGTLEGANDLAKGLPASQIPLKQRLNFDMPANVLFDQSGHIGLSLAKLGGGVLLDLELSAMERQHMLDIVASPSVIATHSEAAMIESGLEIPYEQRSDGGATSAAFKKAVLSLRVMPQITAHHKILLTIEINHDKPGEQTSFGLAVKMQHLKTQVLVNNKETIMIGGIYDTTKENAVDRVPFFGQLPLVGFLFRHKIQVQDRRELLIFITPKILNPEALS